MKKLKYFLIIMLSLFIFTGCANNQSTKFIHNTKKYNNDISFTVTNIEQFETVKNQFVANALEFEITITNKAASNKAGTMFELDDFNFYFTKPQCIFEMFMYEDNYKNKIDFFTSEPNTTKVIYLRIIFNKVYNEKNNIEDDNFVLELAEVRI